MAEPSGDRHRMRRSSCIRSESMFFAIPHPDEEEKAPEKEAELTKEETSVLDLIQNAILIHPSRAVSEVLWFHRNLGLDPFYFRSSSIEQVSEHIMALYAAKILAATSNERLALRLQHETPENALYIVPSLPGVVGSPSEKVEYRIEAEYLREGYTATLEDERLPFEVAEGGYRLQVYRTSGTISPVSNTRLRMYFLQRPKYVEDAPKDPELRAQWEKVTDLNRIADVDFLANSSESLRSQYSSILEEAVDRLGPVYRIVKSKGDEAHMIIAYRYQTTHSFLSGMTALYHYHGLHSSRKYIERFSNGMCIMSLYLYPSKTLTRYSESVSLEERVRRVGEECSLIYVLPRTSLSTLFRQGTLSAAEVAYSYVVWKFAHQFLNSIGDEEFDKINARLDAPSRGVLSKVRQGLKRDAMTESRVAEVIFNYTDIVQALYADFERVFGLPEESQEQNGLSSSSPSVQGRKRSNSIRHEELLSTIRKRATSELDSRILSSFLLFNRQLLKTNFFKKSKVSLSFRLDPSFLSKADYPTTPFAIFFVVGAEFRGFHVRFCDVARGGIRIIRSNNSGSYAINVSTLFEENYNLALTQQRKNKDIPEGGSKGTVLLSVEHQDKPLVAFRKYVDALLDLLLPSEEVRDFYQKPELLFLGPDEGTADYMNWASQHAKHRQYAFWKSFTTGKSRSMGGIPHDFYGMTTRSIHQFVLGILRHLDLDERAIRKFQTGGPDGDLGSNEIKISHDRTVAVVDGSGVLCDPEGINREELLRLASLRLMSRHFDRSKLSPQGFFVDEKDVDVKLPSGRLIEKGLMFRNNFHLEPDYLALVDMFVPCGGRPAAVNISNVHLLYDNENKKPRLKYVVEGANLFFTQEARLQLEEWGVIVFKDASANKGGVTSSSLEVLAALALSDEEFEQHMMVKDDEKVPAFYAEYVQEVQRIIEERAKEEFECLWKEHEQTRVPRSELTDTLSEKINRLNDDIVNSSLWNNANLRVKVISQAIPRNLVQLLGIDVVMKRVPESYLKAIFGAFLASRFVYTRGLNAGEFGFFEFMNDYLQNA